MTATDRLLRLLIPLGVYDFSRGSHSLGQLKAVGSGIDEARTRLGETEKDSCVITASAERLREYARLFGLILPDGSDDGLRAAVIALQNISGDGFTSAAINAAVAGCGINAIVREKDGEITVSFPGVMGVPEGFEIMRTMIDNILPAHLEAEYVFVYLTWEQASALTWQQAGEYTWEKLIMLVM